MSDANTNEKAKAVSVRISESTATHILDKLDAVRRADGTDRRSGERFSYRRPIIVELTQPSGNVMTLKAPSRNISENGISFLHHGYVHSGTRCRVQLLTLHGSWLEVEGAVSRCQYLEGGIHLVGVRFAHNIDIAAFAACAVTRRVLVVDDDPFVSRLVTVLLADMNAEVSSAKNGEEALEAIRNNIYDVVFMDIEMPVLDGLETIKKLRDSGYGGIVVAMTAHTSHGDRERFLTAGFSRYVAKPIDKETMASVFSSLNDEPLFSTLASMEGMAELINQFVDDLGKRVSAVEAALGKGNHGELEKLARALKGEAGSFGFEPISAAAQQVEAALKVAEIDTAALRKNVYQLTQLCRLARKSSVSD